MKDRLRSLYTLEFDKILNMLASYAQTAGARERIYSITPDGSDVNGAWKLPHILTLIGCILTVIALAFVFRKKDKKTRTLVIRILIGLILFFEIARRVINFVKGGHDSLNDVLYTLLPRPWCALSCWAMIVAMFVNKKF